LGWNETYKEDAERQEFFYKVICGNMVAYQDETEYQFSDVLDNLILFYVINQEISKMASENDFLDED
jgi:hypothetical protein